MIYKFKFSIDYRAFIVFLTHEKVNYLNHSPVTNEEVIRSRKYFVDEAGKFQKNLFHTLIAEDANREKLVDYLIAMGGVLLDVRKSDRAEPSFKAQEALNASRNQFHAMKRNESRDSLPSNNPTYKESIKQIYPEEESKQANYETEKVSAIPQQMVQKLQAEIDELKITFSRSFKQQSAQKKESKQHPNKLKAKMPNYILTLKSIGTAPLKTKVQPTLKNIHVLKIQALIRGAIVRRRMTKYRFQQYCIIKIQSHYRGHLVRKHKHNKEKANIHPECEKCKENCLEIVKLREQVFIY